MNTKTKRIAAMIVCMLLTAGGLPVIPAAAANPIVQYCYTADGAPLVYNDTFYLFTGHDEGNSGFYSMNDWRCFSTTDMQNWTDLGSPLHYNVFSWAKGEAWAAQVVARGGKFYYYVTVTAKTGGRAIGVAVADKPDGPYKDAIGKPLVGPMDGMKCIDPTVFVDDDGQAYLYFGNGELRYVLLNDDMISCKTEPVVINTKNGTFGAAFDEAPYLYKRGGKYYMIYASNWLPQDVSYSISDSPTGPWTFGKVIMEDAGGNCGTNHPGIADYKGRTYLTYHDGNLPGGGDYARSECVDEIIWNADGSMQVVKRTKTGPAQIEALNPYQRTEAETINYASGIKTEECSAGGRNVCDVNNGEYIKVSGVDFGNGANTFKVSASSANNGGTLNLHLDSQTGTIIGTVNITATGGWQSWKEYSCDIAGASGKHDLYLTFSGSGSDPLYNLDWWQFGSADSTDISSAEVKSERLIQNLKVNDTENAVDWSVQSGFSRGTMIYGDRDITAANVPEKFSGAEYIRTACDSKMYTGDLASFTVGADANIYAAVDSRVSGSLDWLNEWTKTGDTIKTSNNVTLELFRRAAKSGETVTLGTNGGKSDSVNYLIFAIRKADDILLGDVDKDGAITAKDLTLVKRIARGKAEMNTAADVNCDGSVDRTDAAWYVQYLTAQTNELPAPVIVNIPNEWDSYQETASPQMQQFYQNAILQMGNTTRLREKIAKAQRGENVRLAYIGGSITEGGRTDTCYVSRSAKYFADTFGTGNNVKFTNAGMSGTSSVVGLMRADHDILAEKPDVIFIEFSVNDHPGESYEKGFEGLVRKCLTQEQEPAVIILINRAKGGYSMQEQMAKVGKHYDIPVISMDNALTKAFDSGLLKIEDYFTDNYHPHAEGFKLISDSIAYFYRQALKTENQTGTYTIPADGAFGTEYATATVVPLSSLTGLNKGSWSDTKGYSSSFSYGLAFQKNSANNAMTFKAQGKGLFIVYKANTKDMGTLVINVNGKQSTISGNKQYTWGGPEADLAYIQQSSGELNVSLKVQNAASDFTIWGIGIIQ